MKMKHIALTVAIMAASCSPAMAGGDSSGKWDGGVNNIAGNVDEIEINQCTGSSKNCNGNKFNNEINISGGVGSIEINGEHTVIKGDKGDTGETGAAGKEGAQGVQGERGEQGLKGDRGEQGAQGATGAAGADGKDGTNGKDGVNGTDGKDGINGTNGADGVNGADGTNGVDGKDGAAGEQGVAGLNGTDGLNGEDADMTVVNANTSAIKQANTRVASLEQSVNQRFSDLGKKIDENREHASAGVAGVAAMANIPQVSQGSTFSVGAGLGGYDSESAVAVGISARINNNIVTKASVAMTSQSDPVWGAGLSYEW